MKIGSVYWILLALLPASGFAQPWSFSPAIDVTTGGTDKTFHHLESSGRRNIAVSGKIVAVVWEDDRSGTPAIYLALKHKKSPVFASELKLSAAGEAYEPAITALTRQRFAVSWEEDGQVYVRVINARQLAAPQLSRPIKLPIEQAMQSALVSDGERLLVTFSEHAGRINRLRLIQLKLDSQQNLSLVQACLVDPGPVKNDQLYPSAVIVDQRIIIAWEDRRMGHTIIMASQSHPDDYCQFPTPQRISTQLKRRNANYGKGHGVARVALGRYGQSGIFAAWADKRNFLEGYDIYTAEYIAPGRWGENHPVQDEFGTTARQWHPTVAGHRQDYRVVAWTDEREGHSDIFFSWFEQGGWSEDAAIEQASGPGEQTHSSITLDADGDIHLAWIERPKVGGSTRLKYAFGQLTEKP